jgi:hypothetical protein
MFTFLFGFVVGFGSAIGLTVYLTDKQRKLRELKLKSMRKGKSYVR